MPALYGLIGYPLSHSFSPAYFKKKFAEQNIDAVYEAFPLENIDDLPRLISDQQPRGLNVTIPHKETVIPLLDELDAVAAEIGAVNCIVVRDRRTKGYNTDAVGFEKSLIPLLQPQHKHALVLGTGGSSRAVVYVLRQLGLQYTLVSREQRDGCITYEQLTEDTMMANALIINTTPVGLYPNVDAAPEIPYHLLAAQHLLFDLIYNPEETRFLALGREQGAVTKNGFEMLQLQAEAAWDIWTTGTMPE